MEYKLNMRRKQKSNPPSKELRTEAPSVTRNSLCAVYIGVLGRGLDVDGFSIKITSQQKSRVLKLAPCVSYKQYTYTYHRVNSCWNYYMNVGYIKFMDFLLTKDII